MAARRAPGSGRQLAQRVTLAPRRYQSLLLSAHFISSVVGARRAPLVVHGKGRRACHRAGGFLDWFRRERREPRATPLAILQLALPVLLKASFIPVTVQYGYPSYPIQEREPLSR